MDTLPIDEVLPRVHAAIVGSGAAVVTAPTGAGKTTRVPPALQVDGQVVLVEPRRVAVRAAARRIAEERGVELGGPVGYQVRFDRVASAQTRLLVCTPGVLLRRLQDDPFLDGVGAVVFDEIHERGVPSDLALALCAEVRRDARDDLVLVAMSATLDADRLAGFLDAPVVHSDGRTHPVTVEYLPRPDDRPIADVVADGVRRVLAAGPGDVLAFLPGVREIRHTAERLHDAGVDVVPLYGDLPAAQQDEALRPGPRRRVVLATNVAETSVTVPGVTVVVDAGWVRRPRFDPGTGLDRLETVRVSAASADQRAGRAGRTAPGRCLRLWTARAHGDLAAHEVPEIARVSLAGPLLELLAWGADPERFAWLEAPAPEALGHARALLEDLGATRGGALTARGHQMRALPVHPRLGRMLVEAADLGHPRTGAVAGALLSERDPLGAWTAGRPSDSDLLDRVEQLESGGGHPGGRRRVLQVARQLERLLGRRGTARVEVDEALGRAVLAGWPDRVAARREPASPRARMVGGRGVALHRRSAVRQAALFVCVDVRPQPGDDVVHVASAVERAWLKTTTDVTMAFDPDAEKVRAERVTKYRDLPLETHPAPVDRGDAGPVLEAAARSRLDRVQPRSPSWEGLVARVGSVHAWRPDTVPAVDTALLVELLPALCHGCRSFGSLRDADWAGALRQHLGWPCWQDVQRLAPERLVVPSGREVPLVYTPGEPPVLAVRMQELFGLDRTPSVCDGEVPVRLHLLAPNGRPQQITDDLPGFWDRTWPEVRKELRARYPKHAWPEDPRTATPLRGAQRRRR